MNKRKELDPYLEPLESLQRLLDQFDGQGAIIGGIAVSILGKARHTEDLDAMFLLSTQDIDRLLESAQQEGLEPRIDNVADFARRSRVLLLRHALTGTNIDISLGILPFEQELVERSTLYQVDEGLQLRLPTPEDLVIMKAVAHRPRDLEDIRAVGEKYPNLDKTRIEQWVKAFGEALEMPELWPKIKSILGGSENE